MSFLRVGIEEFPIKFFLGRAAAGVGYLNVYVGHLEGGNVKGVGFAEVWIVAVVIP